ncbi:MAG: HAD family hydrolase [Candidatus Taylorbacteria bacterium RIFCSPHIGHO2_02_FULL_45_28]|uniref:phosphomannomutase n=1 Tax=Candidatus Taylorbacteria bacterium RIFCSPHIGHO2_12_FULL_45_16 TaxID=1802315 RepID=A0A1G2N181_9BACT|nr:MAG: HAD family hydrolase [Candidatus Taylorbacteria bacterium RIFCSPHIGHO2_01_FULL_44_110]OHA25502.1 MAG: HAD family hydrolase [Candidatus Taylorbacteria bacterium RIFCSPHIGHO2_02_FULL_45_28]OHA29169.1 MAG: HAD family hydrolase [Candidatus Taylorbacteria bacterium RIFCSPHIGHO2_12_FULL_45_16]OHA33391.1 MAG: HAD family hydrolase [Candidatus Taylorbacteria bacterium RIFCSPLOWO2_01_FULL_45_59]OHA39477.1 MAG: HAD family hydrolase [Candidatus Taylorbacteria bacterium RIFCSPLOWO2_02_FULL_45_10b]O
MVAYSKKLIIFDLDGTLGRSKCPLDPEIGKLLQKLIAIKKVAIISGGGYPQFQTQILNAFPVGENNFSNLFLVPTSGTRLYTWRGTWNEQYAEHLSPKEKEKIMTSLNSALKQADYIQPTRVYGTIIEDRGSQITFSALGQQAPIAEKVAWDPTRKKRENIVSFLQPKIPEFDVRVGGSTSIDITKKGVNKAYGIRKLEEFLHMTPDDIVFVGDALFPGGNDYPAKATGVDCISVKNPEETKTLIRSWLAE